MKTIMKRTVRYVAGGAFFISVLVLPQTTGAHATAETTAATNTQQTATMPATDGYHFTAKKGDSLTRFARRALQLYQTDKKVTLTPAAAVYGETVIAHALGDSYIEIGQHVTIPSSMLASTAESSKNLSVAQLKKWAQYATTVSFNVDDVQTDSSTPEATPSTTPDVTTDTEADQVPAEDGESTQTEQADITTKRSAGTYWWFIGAGALIAIYFVLGGQSPRPRKR